MAVGIPYAPDLVGCYPRKLNVANVKKSIAVVVMCLCLLVGCKATPNELGDVITPTPASTDNGVAGVYNMPPTVPTYILSESNIRLLVVEDLLVLGPQQLMWARMEILARHGFIMEEPELRNYFACQDWYTPKQGDITAGLSQIEQDNIELIRQREDDLRQRVQVVELVDGRGLLQYGDSPANLVELTEAAQACFRLTVGDAVGEFLTIEITMVGELYQFVWAEQNCLAVPIIANGESQTAILRVDGGQISYLGTIFADHNSICPLEDGTFRVAQAGKWLHNWETERTVLMSNDALSRKPEQLFCMYTPVTLIDSLPLYATPAVSQNTATLPAGTQAKLLWSTIDGTIYVESPAGNGWFAMGDPEHLADGRAGLDVFGAETLILFN